MTELNDIANLMEIFLVAMECEKCDHFDFAMDITQNLHGYNFFSNNESIIEYGRKAAIKDEMIYLDTISEEWLDFESLMDIKHSKMMV